MWLPDYAKAWIEPEFLVGGDNGNTFRERLGNSLAIERIGMIQRETEKAKRMRGGIRDHSQPEISDACFDVLFR